MSKLTKEEVVNALENALSSQQNKRVSIEQKGSWYKIDGGKSLRFSELEAMLAELTPQASPKAKTSAGKAAAPKAAAKPAAVKQAGAKGKTPKELWREKLAALAGHQQLPRGF
ncbi:hypothetical protein [Shewanella salipaludis]|uniref:Uncharacterized protein n=1 Tax=Shewanella salipaludis TaxID=2723052 RepID=A0A972FYH0_9GAMM|nr:hypothetical protein [Shewanella salipaludis]NMH64216.1 hypothetical protein [Shewanella salipaludis]